MGRVTNQGTWKDVRRSERDRLKEDALARLKEEGIRCPEQEVRFHPVRRWRLDLFFREEKVAIEIEGGTGYRRERPSRHLSPQGFEEDARKYAEAAISGILVIRVTPKMIRDGSLVDLVRRALLSRQL